MPLTAAAERVQRRAVYEQRFARRHSCFGKGMAEAGGMPMTSPVERISGPSRISASLSEAIHETNIIRCPLYTSQVGSLDDLMTIIYLAPFKLG